MRRTYVYILLLLVLAGAAYLAWTTRSSTLSKHDSGFGFTNTDEIDQILISDSSSRVILEKAGTWQLNGKTIDQDPVNELIFLASQLHTLSPVAKSMEKEIKKSLKGGIQVEFRHGRKQLRAYRLGKFNKQLYALKKGATKIYRVAVRGYPNVDLTPMLDPHPENWLSKILIHIPAEAIRSVEINYFPAPEKSFSMQVDDAGDIRLFNAAKEDITQQADPQNMQDYLYFFSNIAYEKKAGPEVTLREELKLFDLRLTGNAEFSFSLRGYAKPVEMNNTPDPFVFYGYNSSEGLLLLNYSDFDPILVPVQYFLKK